MKTMKVIDVELARRHGETISDIMLEFGFVNEDSFLRSLRGLYVKPNSYKSIVDSLRMNEKRHERHSRTKVIRHSQEQTEVADDITVEPIQCPDESSENSMSTEVTTDTTTTKKDILSALYVEEETCSKLVINLELQHKELTAAQGQRSKELSEINKELQALQKQLTNLRTRIAEILEESMQISEQMAEVTATHRIEKTRLTAIRKQIDNLKTVAICVYADGQLEIDGDAFNVQSICNDTNFYTHVIPVLQTQTAHELNLSVNEGYAIANLKRILEHLIQNDIRYEVLYDNINVQLFMENQEAA